MFLAFGKTYIFMNRGQESFKPRLLHASIPLVRKACTGWDPGFLTGFSLVGGDGSFLVLRWPQCSNNPIAHRVLDRKRRDSIISCAACRNPHRHICKNTPVKFWEYRIKVCLSSRGLPNRPCLLGQPTARNCWPTQAWHGPTRHVVLGSAAGPLARPGSPPLIPSGLLPPFECAVPIWRNLSI